MVVNLVEGDYVMDILRLYKGVGMVKCILRASSLDIVTIEWPAETSDTCNLNFKVLTEQEAKLLMLQELM